MALTVLSILCVLSVAFGKSVYQHQACSTDADCTYPATYCYKSGMCVECTDCSKYNRQPGSNCAKDKNQCGLCLTGMQKVENTDGSFSCEPSGTVTPSTQAPNVESYNYTLYIVLGCVLFAMIVICFVIFYVYQKYSHSKSFYIYFHPILKFCPSCCVQRCEQTHTEGPPPYSEHPMASAPPYENPPLTRTVITPVENDPNQTANAFLNPRYIRGGNLANEDPDPEEVGDGVEPAEDDALINQSISHPDDEVTQPSDWSPTNRPENTSTPAPTSFHGLISNMHISQPDVREIAINNSQISLSQQNSRSSSQPSIEFVSSNQQENSSDGNGNITIDLGLRISVPK